MDLLCMVTYLTDSEIFTADLRKTAASLHETFGDKFKVILCCEKEMPALDEESYQIEQRILPKTTKYRRFIDVLKNDDSAYYLSIDNDIQCNLFAVKNFFEAIINNECDIGWGKIKAQKNNGLISKLVMVDKMLSHNILRPLLWKFGVGISVPGQIFCLKGNSYRGKLFELNTFLDDLAIGLYSSNTKKKVLMMSAVLGYEQPNVSFKGIRQQRIRWAKGYAAIFHSLKDTSSLAKVIVHAIAYHFLWLIHWLIMFLLINLDFFFAVVYVLLATLILTRENFSLAGYAFLYQLVFPIFHIFWIVELLSELNRLR